MGYAHFRIFFSEFGEHLPSLVEFVLSPFYAVPILPGFLLEWTFVLGDNGTTESLTALGTIFSLPVNMVAGALVGWLATARQRAS